MRTFLFAVAVAACASSPSSQPITAESVIATERAFAARAGVIGWIPAFREYVAPDGQMAGASGVVDAPAQLAAADDDGARNLFWWPAFAGIARSGDLGFTTGPYSVDEARAPRGQYFTVWRRQADGAWKWIWDGGPGPRPDPLDNGVDASALPTLPIADRGVGQVAAADAVRAIENDAASAGALGGYLAADARVFRPAQPTGARAGDSFVLPNADVAYATLRTEASLAGDLVFTLGEARWTQGGEERRGHFARIWQLRAEGWRIVYDQLTAGPS